MFLIGFVCGATSVVLAFAIMVGLIMLHVTWTSHVISRHERAINKLDHFKGVV